VLFNTFAGFSKRPFLVPHEHIHAVAGTTCEVFTAALIAEPSAVAV